MTDAQKEMILNMRQAGHGYKKIATVLGLSANTVKSFFRRNEPAKSNASDAQSIIANNAFSEQCKQCGVPISQVAGIRKRRFCSTACRNAWWNAHRASPGRKSVCTLACGHCGKLFSTNELTRKYCDHACYIAGRYGKERRHDTGAV